MFSGKIASLFSFVHFVLDRVGITIFTFDEHAGKGKSIREKIEGRKTKKRDRKERAIQRKKCRRKNKNPCTESEKEIVRREDGKTEE